MKGERTMKKLSQLLAALAVVMTFGIGAYAQVEQPSQISIQGTGLITKSTDNNGSTYDTTKSGGFLLGYSYQFNSWAGLEGNYGYTRNTQNFSAQSSASAIQANVHEVTGSFVAHFPTGVRGVHPYALAGGGALVFDPTTKYIVSGSQAQTRGAFVYGAGVNFDVVQNFGIRAEYRGLVYKAPDFTLDNLNLDKFTHLAQPSVGFFFRF
jgi:opacity protein-like surface antigen